MLTGLFTRLCSFFLFVFLSNSLGFPFINSEGCLLGCPVGFLLVSCSLGGCSLCWLLTRLFSRLSYLLLTLLFSRLMLSANPHFSGIPVNTSRSSVHVPTNVFDGEPKVNRSSYHCVGEPKVNRSSYHCVLDIVTLA